MDTLMPSFPHLSNELRIRGVPIAFGVTLVNESGKFIHSQDIRLRWSAVSPLIL
jgi:hypothetical protein